MKDASSLKKLASYIIDAITIYTAVPFYIYLTRFEIRHLWSFVFVFGIFLQSLTYFSIGQALGERCLGLLVLSDNGYPPDKLKLFLRSFMKSSVFVPWVMPPISIITAGSLILMSIVVQFVSTTRGKSLMAWDVILHTIVVEGGPQVNYHRIF